MAYKEIPKDAWNQATTALLRYCENLPEMNHRLEVAMSRDPEKGNENGVRPSHPDPTASAAVRLSQDLIYQRIKREVAAVQNAIKDLKPEELEVIRRRFWCHRKGIRKTKAYDYLQDLGYSTRQMKRIVRKVIYLVAINLGEI